MSSSKRDTKSFVSYFIAMLIFGTIGIFRKFIPISSVLLVCLRGFVGTLFLVVFMIIRKKKLFEPIGLKKFWLLALTGAMIGLNWLLLFESYRYTTVGIATLCYYMAPTFLIFLSPIFLKDKMTLKKLICAVISLIGMVFVSGVIENGGITSSDGIGILLGLMAAVLYAFIVMLNKKVQIENPIEKTVIQLFFAAFVLLPYVLTTENFTNMDLQPFAILMIAFVCLVHTGIAYALYFSSISKLSTQSVAIFSYLDPVAALILSAVFLQEKMSTFGILGAVLIIGAACICEMRFKHK